MKVEYLCRGENGYAPAENLAELFDKNESDITSIRFFESCSRIQMTIDDVLRSLKQRSEREIELFTIGKSHAQERADRIFDPVKFSTWKLDNGVNSRWNTYYKKNGYDGLVVIGCITERMLPKQIKEQGNFNQEDYALALEQNAIHYYQFDICNQANGNTSLDVGNKCKSANYSVSSRYSNNAHI